MSDSNDFTDGFRDALRRFDFKRAHELKLQWHPGGERCMVKSCGRTWGLGTLSMGAGLPDKVLCRGHSGVLLRSIPELITNLSLLEALFGREPNESASARAVLEQVQAFIGPQGIHVRRPAWPVATCSGCGKTATVEMVAVEATEVMERFCCDACLPALKDATEKQLVETQRLLEEGLGAIVALEGFMAQRGAH